MDVTNKKILQEVVTRLENSTSVNWLTGDLDDWSDFANRMKNTIKTVTPILKTLVETPAQPTINQKQIKEQKVVITDYPNDVNKLLLDGWRIESVTAQHVSTATSSSSPSTVRGTFCFVLYK